MTVSPSDTDVCQCLKVHDDQVVTQVTPVTLLTEAEFVYAMEFSPELQFFSPDPSIDHKQQGNNMLSS